MSTTLCFDFGNTRLKCAVFNDRNLTELIVLNDCSVDEVNRLIQQYHPTHAILSSVINHLVEIEKLLEEKTLFHKLSHESKLPITSPVAKPESIGADRLAICSAATSLFPDNHNLVIGLGSCITYNFINKAHEFIGGSISPGMNMRFKSMNEQTAKLPPIIPEHIFPLIGYDTKTNLLSGVIIGIAKEIDGFIDEYKERYDNLKVILTGGDMNFFIPHLKNEVIADPYLLYWGLLSINEMNN